MRAALEKNLVALEALAGGRTGSGSCPLEDDAERKDRDGRRCKGPPFSVEARVGV